MSSKIILFTFSQYLYHLQSQNQDHLHHQIPQVATCTSKTGNLARQVRQASKTSAASQPRSTGRGSALELPSCSPRLKCNNWIPTFKSFCFAWTCVCIVRCLRCKVTLVALGFDFSPRCVFKSAAALHRPTRRSSSGRVLGSRRRLSEIPRPRCYDLLRGKRPRCYDLLRGNLLAAALKLPPTTSLSSMLRAVVVHFSVKELALWLKPFS